MRCKKSADAHQAVTTRSQEAGRHPGDDDGASRTPRCGGVFRDSTTDFQAVVRSVVSSVVPSAPPGPYRQCADAVVAGTAVEPLADYILRLTFDDGSERVVDLADELWGPMGEPLRDPAYFRQVRVDPELRTIVWPNGFDLDPDVLHGRPPRRRRPARRTTRPHSRLARRAPSLHSALSAASRVSVAAQRARAAFSVLQPMPSGDWQSRP
jgi:hypothetical protein